MRLVNDLRQRHCSCCYRLSLLQTRSLNGAQSYVPPSPSWAGVGAAVAAAAGAGRCGSEAGRGPGNSQWARARVLAGTGSDLGPDHQRSFCPHPGLSQTRSLFRVPIWGWFSPRAFMLKLPGPGEFHSESFGIPSQAARVQVADPWLWRLRMAQRCVTALHWQ